MVVLLRREKGSVHVCTAAYVYTAAHYGWVSRFCPFITNFWYFHIPVHMGFLFKLISTEWISQSGRSFGGFFWAVMLLIRINGNNSNLKKREQAELTLKKFYGLCAKTKCALHKLQTRGLSRVKHRGFLDHWNSQKSVSNIWQHFSCLLDEWIEKICKNLFSRWLFFKSTLSVLRCTWTGRINLKIFLGHHINYLSIWPFMCHPWFPTRKASKLTFVCFQLQLSSPCIVFNKVDFIKAIVKKK